MPHHKQVHFDSLAGDLAWPHTHHSHVVPYTSSPVFSTVSLSSPSPPSTPCSFDYHHTSLPLVESHGHLERVHPGISYHHGRVARFHFDVTVPPPLPEDSFPHKLHHGGWFPKCFRSSAQQSSLTGHTPSPFNHDLSHLDEPVMYPHMNSIILLSHLLPWSIIVRGESLHDEVTLFDMWQTLHDFFRAPIPDFEWNSLPAYTRNVVSAAFYRRINGIWDHYLREEQFRRGVRRLDFLLGYTTLAGISTVSDRAGYFNLHWGFPS